LVVAGFLALLSALAFFAFRASQQVPEFYAQALQADPAVQKHASDEMVQKTTALVNNLKKEGDWEALFTDVQVNGWLASDLEEHYPDALPRGVRDPRVVIEPEQVIFAFRMVRGKW